VASKNESIVPHKQIANKQASKQASKQAAAAATYNKIDETK
jgi:hypothetical protein